ncbi:MAG TPA: DNA topoisomerase IB [Caulobacteraceae bacterium]|jgi:DNA topoisomerase-1|nr:DNA topoisomerase IB [Caulobacteraceae bacterium]
MARDCPELPPLNPIIAASAGLTYVNDHDPGLSRVAAPDGKFRYRDAEGRMVRDAKTLDRIAGLVIPPAWTDVWICPDPRGHIQVTGRDQRRRKQYRYHADWRAVRDQNKYQHLAAFARALPRLRRQLDIDLSRRGLARERVLAAVVRLLEVTLIRIGNDEYAKANNSFGLTTLRKRHVHANGAGAVFEFRGKSGKLHRTGFQDRRLARLVRSCQELRGQRLFQFVDETGELRPVESADVNDYLHAAMGADFTAKDFRTWAGTLAALEWLQGAEPAQSGAMAKRMVAACVKDVAARLGNTPAVCRACYIHPAVIEAYAAGTLPPKGRNPERTLLKFLDDAAVAA